MIKDILLFGIYNLDVRREELGTTGIEDKTVNDLVRIEAKEAAQDTEGGNRPAATAAAASYKK